MRKGKQPLPPPDFFYLRDVLPDLATSLKHELKRIGRADVAALVPELRIYSRCHCPAACGTFCCIPEPEMQVAIRSAVSVDCLTVSKGRIIEVRTLDPNVDAVLRRLFPEQADPFIEDLS